MGFQGDDLEGADYPDQGAGMHTEVVAESNVVEPEDLDEGVAVPTADPVRRRDFPRLDFTPHSGKEEPMANDTEQPQELHASDTVAQQSDSQDGVVSESRLVAPDPGPGSQDMATNLAERRRTLRSRYGGYYWGADFLGFAVAGFFTVVLLGIVGAIVGAVGYQLNTPVPKIGGTISGATQNLGIGALVGSLVALFLAYLIGGYAAGRMARFSGVKNGVGVWLWTIVVAILLAIAGAIAGNKFNVASQIHLNVNRATLTTTGAISIAVTLVVMLVAAIIGGSMGQHFHRHIDEDTGAPA